MDAMMASDEYQTAKASGDAAEMGRHIMEAKVRGMNEYNASDGAKLALESEKTLVDAIRNDTSLNQDYWDAGYEKGQEFSKGLAAGMAIGKDMLSAWNRKNRFWTLYWYGQMRRSPKRHRNLLLERHCITCWSSGHTWYVIWKTAGWN